MEREFCKKCSKCGERSVVIATTPYELQMDHDGRKYEVKIPKLTVPQCSKCGNFSLDYEADMQITRAFCQQAGLLTGEEIRRHRDKLGLSQQALAELLDVESSELAWWENGERIQQWHMDRFLRAFFAVPELRRTLADKQALALSP
jgi:putative zinc finger/helix-turn-helix YgiT family protein